MSDLVVTSHTDRESRIKPMVMIFIVSTIASFMAVFVLNLEGRVDCVLYLDLLLAAEDSVVQEEWVIRTRLSHSLFLVDSSDFLSVYGSEPDEIQHHLSVVVVWELGHLIIFPLEFNLVLIVARWDALARCVTWWVVVLGLKQILFDIEECLGWMLVDVGHDDVFSVRQLGEQRVGTSHYIVKHLIFLWDDGQECRRIHRLFLSLDLFILVCSAKGWCHHLWKVHQVVWVGSEGVTWNLTSVRCSSVIVLDTVEVWHVLLSVDKRWLRHQLRL